MPLIASIVAICRRKVSGTNLKFIIPRTHEWPTVDRHHTYGDELIRGCTSTGQSVM